LHEFLFADFFGVNPVNRAKSLEKSVFSAEKRRFSKKNEEKINFFAENIWQNQILLVSLQSQNSNKV
jgi:hypothetical protein